MTALPRKGEKSKSGPVPGEGRNYGLFEGGHYGLFFNFPWVLEGGDYGLFSGFPWDPAGGNYGLFSGVPWELAGWDYGPFSGFLLFLGQCGPRPSPRCKIGNFNAYGSEGPGAILVFRPTAWSNEPCDGAFLVDSFHYLKTAGRKRKQTQYFQICFSGCGKRLGWFSLLFVLAGGLLLGLVTARRRMRTCWWKCLVRLGM